jgi:murein DD-endopeptidase MepM/ murein hydrolase activator NlpD
MVWFSGSLQRGGNVVVVLGPKWRFHYYAHLNAIYVKKGTWVRTGAVIGSIGTSGNAAGKPPHLHYTIVSLFPLFWKADDSVQGWKKMYYLNPNDYLVKRD